MRPFKLSVVTMALSAGALLFSGCVLAPKDAKHQRHALRESGREFAQPLEKRQLPELPENPDWPDVLRRAMLANGELEAAYFDWAMAVHRIPQAGAYPNTPLSVSFEYMFSGDNLKSFDRTTTTISPDAMENLSWPSQVYRAGAIATHEAQAAQQRFLAAKFDLQRRVLNDWFDYALLAEKLRIQREILTLLEVSRNTAATRVGAGAPQQELLRSDIELKLAQDEQKTLEAQLAPLRARLNAMMAREPDAPLAPPERIEPRPLSIADARLLALAAENNPELASLAHEAEGREDAIELARSRFWPEVNPFAGFTGSVSQFVGVGVSLPTVLPELRGRLAEARADLRRAQAMYRQTRHDNAAQAVAALVMIRDSERRADLFEQQIIPLTERVAGNLRQSYSAGRSGLLDLLEAQRTLLEARLTLAEVRATREKSLADLEAIIATDIEKIDRDSTTPTTQATTSPALSGTESHHEK